MAVNLKYGGGSAVATFASSLTALYLYVLPKDTGPEVFKGCRYLFIYSFIFFDGRKAWCVLSRSGRRKLSDGSGPLRHRLLFGIVNCFFVWTANCFGSCENCAFFLHFNKIPASSFELMTTLKLICVFRKLPKSFQVRRLS